MSTKPKFGTANDLKRPLYLETRGGPMPYMRVDERTPRTPIPISEETGGGIAGHYHLKGSVYEYVPNR